MGVLTVHEQGRRAGGVCVSVSEVFRDRENGGEEDLLERGATTLETDWEGKVWVGERVGGRLTGNRAAAAGESGVSAEGGLPADPAPGRSGWRVRLKGGEKG